MARNPRFEMSASLRGGLCLQASMSSGRLPLPFYSMISPLLLRVGKAPMLESTLIEILFPSKV